MSCVVKDVTMKGAYKININNVLRTGWVHCALVSRNSVFIHGDSNVFQDPFSFGATKFDVAQINQNYVIVSAIRDNFVTQILKIFAKCLSIGYYCFLIGPESWQRCLLHSNSNGCNGMVVRPSLKSGEDSFIDSFLVVIVGIFAGFDVHAFESFSAKNDSSSWASEGFMYS